MNDGQAENSIPPPKTPFCEGIIRMQHYNIVNIQGLLLAFNTPICQIYIIDFSKVRWNYMCLFLKKSMYFCKREDINLAHVCVSFSPILYDTAD